MSTGRNSTLFPRRLSSVTHGHFAVGPQGMYFKFDHCLNPTLVYGAMLRLEQVNWLDRFHAIVCEYDQDMWELRKALPGKADIISDVHDAVIESDKPFLIVCNSFAYGYYGYNSEYEYDDIENATVIDISHLWPVTTPTADYTCTKESA